jgi:alpha-tubulin suppressor-like RCC1 family protein
MIDGTVFGCGINQYGQLGIDIVIDINYNKYVLLTQMINTTGKTPAAISAGADFSIVLMRDGTVFGCGSNQYGQLGTGDNINKNVLTQMINTTGKTPVAISAIGFFSIVLMSDGTVFGCGWNSKGQLGIGSNVNKNVLTQMKLSTGNYVSNVIALNSTRSFVPIISNICFPAGTPIVTNQGNIPIEQINPSIHTIRNKPIIGITQTVTHDKYLVCFEKDSIGINIPSQKTIISKNHKIFFNKKMMQAKEFIGLFENVYKIKYNGEILYNVLMEDYDKMVVNNLVCETLHPENDVAKIHKVLHLLSPSEQENLIKTYNEHVKKSDRFSCKKLTK